MQNEKLVPSNIKPLTSRLLPMAFFLFFFPFFLRFVNQTLGAKFAVEFGIATRYPFLKTWQAISNQMLLTGKDPFSVRMVSTLGHMKSPIP
jgi:hypothetical protein